MGNQDAIRREIAASQLHTIQEEIDSDFGTAISEDIRNGGDQSSLPEQQETNIDGEMLENAELGGAKRSSFKIPKG